MVVNHLQVLRSLDDPPSIVFDGCLKLPVFQKGAMVFRGFHLSDARLVSWRLVVVGPPASKICSSNSIIFPIFTTNFRYLKWRY